jgi:hypothetical protein
MAEGIDSENISGFFFYILMKPQKNYSSSTHRYIYAFAYVKNRVRMFFRSSFSLEMNRKKRKGEREKGQMR